MQLNDVSSSEMRECSLENNVLFSKKETIQWGFNSELVTLTLPELYTSHLSLCPSLWLEFSSISTLCIFVSPQQHVRKKTFCLLFVTAGWGLWCWLG